MKTTMWILWFAPLFLNSVATAQIIDEHRYISGAGDTCIFNCDGEYECIAENKKCEALMKHFDLCDQHNAAFKELLIYGHNGLRNRLATKLDVCDMLVMTWDNTLADLANRHHQNCTRFLTCDVEKRRPSSEEDMSRLYLPVTKGNNTDVARNSFFLRNIYARHFLVFALAIWYETHIELESPTQNRHKTHSYYRVNGDNSFTHMIRPQTHKLGCSYAMFRDGLSLICYYFPYIHENKTVLLRIKPKEYQCPYSFPIFDPVFKRLCKYANY